MKLKALLMDLPHIACQCVPSALGLGFFSLNRFGTTQFFDPILVVILKSAFEKKQLKCQLDRFGTNTHPHLILL